eukprot:Skav211991  [mRNA]  locus=scaffold2069:106240:110024:+ [translate_table: standard]
MDGFARGEEWKRALSQLEAARGEVLGTGGGMVDVISFNAAISACEAAAKWEEAFEVLKNLRLCASDSPDVLQADVISFNAAISSGEKSGRWQEALDVFLAAQLNQVQANAQNWFAQMQQAKVVTGLGRAGRAREAAGWLFQMEEARNQRRK